MTFAQAINSGYSEHLKHQRQQDGPPFIEMPKRSGTLFYPTSSTPLIFLSEVFGNDYISHVFDISKWQFSLLVSQPASQKLVTQTVTQAAQAYLSFDLPVRDRKGYLLKAFPYYLQTPRVSRRLQANSIQLAIKLAKETARLFREVEQRKLYVRYKCRFTLIPERGEALLLPFSLTDKKLSKSQSPLFALIFQLESLFFNAKDLRKAEHQKQAQEGLTDSTDRVYRWILKALHPKTTYKTGIEEIIQILDEIYQNLLGTALVLPMNYELSQRLVQKAYLTLQAHSQVPLYPHHSGYAIEGEDDFSVKPLPAQPDGLKRMLIRGRFIGEGLYKVVFRGLLVVGSTLHNVAISVLKADVGNDAKREKVISRELLFASEKGGMPNIVPIWETKVIRLGERLYFEQIQSLMQTDLASATTHALLNLRQTAKVFKDITVGLGFYQQAKTFYGDLKPENILLKFSEGNQVEAFLGDIASGGLKGVDKLGFASPTFSSPERIEANLNSFLRYEKTKVRLTHDLWSFGATLLYVYYRLSLEFPSLQNTWDSLKAYEDVQKTEHLANFRKHLMNWKSDVRQAISALPNEFPTRVIQRTLVDPETARMSLTEIQVELEKELL